MLNGQKVEIPLGGNFDPVPMDKYTVQCVDVNMVIQRKFQSSEEEEVLSYKFAILDEKTMMVTNEDGEKVKGTTRGRYLWKRCRLALGNQAWLRQLAEAAIGRALTKDELKTFDPESLVGLQVDVMVKPTEKDDKIYVNIVSFGKTETQLKPVDSSELKKTGQVLEKETAAVPTTAPDADNPDDFVSGLEAAGKVKVKKVEVVEQVEETTDEVAELKKKLEIAEAKAARAK